MNKYLKKFKLCLYPRFAYYLNIISNKWTKIEVYGQENITELDDNTTIIYVLWHGKIWLPMYVMSDSSHYALLSSSRDGEYLNKVLVKFGYQGIRGSSSRGGGRALLKVIRKLKEGGSIIITPDGPRGPIHKVKPGTVYIQEKCRGVIIPIGVAIEKKKVFSSWDSFNLPLPGTRAVILYGSPFELPLKLNIEERGIILEKRLMETEKKAAALLNRQVEASV